MKKKKIFFLYKKKKNIKINACGCQRSAVGCLIEDKKSKSKEGHNPVKYAF